MRSAKLLCMAIFSNITHGNWSVKGRIVLRSFFFITSPSIGVCYGKCNCLGKCGVGADSVTMAGEQPSWSLHGYFCHMSSYIYTLACRGKLYLVSCYTLASWPRNIILFQETQTYLVFCIEHFEFSREQIQ